MFPFPSVITREAVPTSLAARIAFYDRKAAHELAAYRRAHTLRIWLVAAKHRRQYETYRDEAARLRAYQKRLRPAIVGVRPGYVPATFRPAVQAPSVIFQQVPVLQQAPAAAVTETPETMDPSTAADATIAAASPSPGVTPLGVGLVLLGAFVVYKVVTRKKGSDKREAA